MVGYYSLWTLQLVGPHACLSLYLFFLLGASIAHLILNPIAALVGQSEQREADFRMAHVRWGPQDQEI